MAINLALVVGINTYRDRTLRSLKYAKRDAELMYEYLLNQARFTEICLFSDNSSDFQGYSTHPSRSSLRKFLRDRFESSFLQKEDNFWFFFSGHGIRYQGRDYLLPEDGYPDDPSETAIPLNWVTERLSRSGAGNIVLILDACRNEVGMKGSGAFGQEQQEGVTTIFSCKPEESSWEIDEPICQGSFTYILLETFLSQAPERCLTIEQTELHLKQRVFALNQQHGKRRQTPHIQISQTGKAKQVLLPHLVPLMSIEKLKSNASRAEEVEDFSLAEELWVEILRNSETSREEAIESLRRIIEKKVRKSDRFTSIASTFENQPKGGTLDSTTPIKQVNKNSSPSSGTDRYQIFVTRANSGKITDVDFFMKTLVESQDIATQKLIDFAMGLVKTREGQERIKHYLFNGSQHQKNYAALYFKRRAEQHGDKIAKSILIDAVNQGCIDKVQAFSK